jgi:hypothetical protein
VPCVREKCQTIGPKASNNLYDEVKRGQDKDNTKSGFASLSRKPVTVVVMMMFHEYVSQGGSKET